ncbi:MAG TPA: hypothetical protein VG890_11065, partial [Puia sp.]|nr:hypothetical protein [Puia sp.]
WDKHFKNIRDFIPVCRKLGYQGMVMTSWSTSGEYDAVHESSSDLVDLYAVRHVYPLAGFNILLAAYSEALRTDNPLNIPQFVRNYCAIRYGFNTSQTDSFWHALTAAPYEVSQGVVSDPSVSLPILIDSARQAAAILHSLKPSKGEPEFEHYRLMADIRLFYLEYQGIGAEANAASFTSDQVPALLTRLKQLKAKEAGLNKRFAELNKAGLYPAEIAEENQIRNQKIDLLFNRLAGIR